MPAAPRGGKDVGLSSSAAPTVPPGLPPRARHLISTYPDLWNEFLQLTDAVVDEEADHLTEDWSAFYVAFDRLRRLKFPFDQQFIEAVDRRTAVLALVSDDESDPAELDADLEPDRPLKDDGYLNAAWAMIDAADAASAADLRRQQEQVDRLMGGAQ